MRIACIVGARPNFVKISPILAELRGAPGVAVTLIHTGQHYDLEMSEAFFAHLDIPKPDVNLGVRAGSAVAQIAEILQRLESVLAADVLTVEEMAERMQCGNVPHNALAITFDDGYRDNLTHAAPVLARYGVPATIFLATGFIGSAQALWYDQLAMAFKMTERASFEAPWGEALALSTLADRLQALQRTVQHLKRLPDDELRCLVDGALEELGVSRQDGLRDLMLSWEEVSRLARLGFSIGARMSSRTAGG